jgi:hypothetical protein
VYEAMEDDGGGGVEYGNEENGREWSMGSVGAGIRGVNLNRGHEKRNSKTT